MRLRPLKRSSLSLRPRCAKLSVLSRFPHRAYYGTLSVSTSRATPHLSSPSPTLLTRSFILIFLFLVDHRGAGDLSGNGIEDVVLARCATTVVVAYYCCRLSLPTHLASILSTTRLPERSGLGRFTVGTTTRPTVGQGVTPNQSVAIFYSSTHDYGAMFARRRAVCQLPLHLLQHVIDHVVPQLSGLGTLSLSSAWERCVCCTPYSKSMGRTS